MTICAFKKGLEMSDDLVGRFVGRGLKFNQKMQASQVLYNKVYKDVKKAK